VDEPDITRRQWQQLGGMLIAFLGAGGVIALWCIGIFERLWYPKSSFLFPAFLVLGLGLILFPGYREERMARGEDISGKQGLALITLRWWAILAVASIAGVANYLAMGSM